MLRQISLREQLSSTAMGQCRYARLSSQCCKEDRVMPLPDENRSAKELYRLGRTQFAERL
jgi:hypothetical protein